MRDIHLNGRTEARPVHVEANGDITVGISPDGRVRLSRHDDESTVMLIFTIEGAPKVAAALLEVTERAKQFQQIEAEHERSIADG